jgi:queuine tRNA-ribosyltransferase
MEDRFPVFLKGFFEKLYGARKNYPEWAVNALRKVNVDLLAE